MLPLPTGRAFLSLAMLILVTAKSMPAHAQGSGCLAFFGLCIPAHQQSLPSGDDQQIVRAADGQPKADRPLQANLPVQQIDDGLVPFRAEGYVVRVPARFFGVELDATQQLEFGVLVQRLVDEQIAAGILPQRFAPSAVVLSAASTTLRHDGDVSAEGTDAVDLSDGATGAALQASATSDGEVDPLPISEDGSSTAGVVSEAEEATQSFGE